MLTFRSADEQGLGVLTTKDIASALKAQGLEVPEDLSEIFDGMDMDGKRPFSELNRCRVCTRALSPNLCHCC